MSKKVRVGVIGTSWWVDQLYVPSLNSHAGADVVAVCGRNAERASEIAAKFGGSEVFTDYRALLASGLDAVVVATPDDLHYEMTMAALDAGLHVLCEKPLSGNAAQAREMLAKAETAGVKHMVLFTWRWQPHWRYMKHLVDDGYIGRCCHASVDFIGGFALDQGYKWRFDGRRANGITGDLGSHMVDFARWYLGDVVRVSADLPVFTDQSAEANPPPLPVNDAGFLTLEHASGARSQVKVSAVALLADQVVRVRVHLHGDAGSLEAEHTYLGVDAGVALRGVRKGEHHFQALSVPPEFLSGGARATEIFDPYTRQSAGPRAFVDAILEDTPADPGFSVGVRTQEVIDAALRSNAERRWVSVA